MGAMGAGGLAAVVLSRVRPKGRAEGAPLTGPGRPPDNLAPGLRGQARTLWHFSRPSPASTPRWPCLVCAPRGAGGAYRRVTTGLREADSGPALGAASSERPRAERTRQAEAT